MSAQAPGNDPVMAAVGRRLIAIRWRSDQPQVEAAGFFQLGGGGRGAKLDRVEAERAEPFEWLAAMLDGPRREGSGVDHEQRAVDRRHSVWRLRDCFGIGRASS